ncbi:hypothetical protein F384_27690 (plasmid) [Citrobacter amalonaticus Y19]|uniref:Uncharacterized protein n=1 Tax=Citrobacter amalonaticus Y19 TaxID=1261127 RepID=A0A0F6RIU3_CITAM|nr:hypothetical protein F384_27690 [Citrobacter amalonaticus Y19]
MGVALNIQSNYIELQNWLEKAKSIYSSAGCPHERVDDGILKISMQVAAIRKTNPDMLHEFLQELITEFKGYKLIQCRFNKSNYEYFVMPPEIQVLIGGLMDKASEGIMLASICHMLQVDTLSELLSLIPTGMPDTDVLDSLWRDQKTPAGLNLLDDFVLLDAVALANKRGITA